MLIFAYVGQIHQWIWLHYLNQKHKNLVVHLTKYMLGFVTFQYQMCGQEPNMNLVTNQLLKICVIQNLSNLIGFSHKYYKCKAMCLFSHCINFFY